MDGSDTANRQLSDWTTTATADGKYNNTKKYVAALQTRRGQRPARQAHQCGPTRQFFSNVAREPKELPTPVVDHDST